MQKGGGGALVAQVGIVPVGVFNLATCVCIKSEEEGLVKKKYFEFGLQYLVSILHTAHLTWQCVQNGN